MKRFEHNFLWFLCLAIVFSSFASSEDCIVVDDLLPISTFPGSSEINLNDGVYSTSILRSDGQGMFSDDIYDFTIEYQPGNNVNFNVTQLRRSANHKLRAHEVMFHDYWVLSSRMVDHLSNVEGALPPNTITHQGLSNELSREIIKKYNGGTLGGIVLDRPELADLTSIRSTLKSFKQADGESNVTFIARMWESDELSYLPPKDRAYAMLSALPRTNGDVTNQFIGLLNSADGSNYNLGKIEFNSDHSLIFYLDT